MSTESNGSIDTIFVKPIFQRPDEKQAATSFAQFVVPTPFCVTHCIHVTSHVALHPLNRLQKKKDLNARQINPEQFERRILFMSMFNDTNWTKNGNSCTFSRMPEK